MLDTRFKELCNGLCSAGGSTKSTKKTINAVNSASKILEIYRSLPAAGAARRCCETLMKATGASSVCRGSAATTRTRTSRFCAGRSSASARARRAVFVRAARNGSPRCESVDGVGVDARRTASRTVAKMVLADATTPTRREDGTTQRAPARRKTQTASLASMMENLAKPPAPPRKSSSADESSRSKADEEALRKFVVDVVGEKYWPVFEREEIEDLKTLRCCTARDLQDMKIPLGPRLKLLSNLEGRAA